jgi:hypothetical protein
MTGIAPLRPSKIRTNAATFLPPIRRTFVAPGLPDPWVLGSGRLQILHIIMALEIDPSK